MSIINKLSTSVSHIGFFWQEKFNGQIFRWNIFFLGIQGLLLFFKFIDLPPQIPIFYSQPWGESQLGSNNTIFLLPLIATIILFLNNSLAVYYLKSSALISRILVVTSLFSTIFSTIAVFKIISLVS